MFAYEKKIPKLKYDTEYVIRADTLFSYIIMIYFYFLYFLLIELILWTPNPRLPILWSHQLPALGYALPPTRSDMLHV